MGGRLTKTQLKTLEELSSNKQFIQLIEHVEMSEDKWVYMMDSPNAENYIPEKMGFEGHESDITKDIKKLILLKILRPDRFIAAAKIFVSKVLGDQIFNVGDLDLMRIVEKESHAKSPLLLVSAPGFDASYKVDMLAK